LLLDIFDKREVIVSVSNNIHEVVPDILSIIMIYSKKVDRLIRKSIDTFASVMRSVWFEENKNLLHTYI
jgi:hypothetical protein